MSITPSPQNPYQCRSLFVSDLHMGSHRFDADLFMRFVASYNPDTIYLVGDIIDGWKLAKRWYWPVSYQRSMSYLLSLADGGKQIFYITGNHDDRLRLLPLPLRMGFKNKYGLDIVNSLNYTTLDDKNFLVIHGDQFDWKILHGRLSKYSDWLFDFVTTRILPIFNPRVKIDGKRKKFSMAKAIRKSGNYARYLIINFEKAVFKRIEQDKVDGLICGHTHVPIHKIENGKTYINTGSWMASTPTALIEHHDGRFELIKCNPQSYQPNGKNDFLISEEHMEKAKNLEIWAKRLWESKFKIAPSSDSEV